MQQGRVQVSVPAVLGEGRLSWAMPCVPYAGSGVGFFAVPPVGANVWVEFEGGDPDYPILGGCFWGVGEAPAKPALAETKVLKTAGITLTLSDLPGRGGFTLEVGPPAVPAPLKLVFNAGGIELHERRGEHQAHPGQRLRQQRRAGGDLMPGFLLHVGATVLCLHAGQAQPVVPNPRVMVGGQPVVNQTSPYTVAGCAFTSLRGAGPA